MERKHKFNWMYNADETIGFGKGYYIIFEGSNYEPMVDTMYKTWEYNEQVDGISVGILNKFRYLEDLGYVYDRNFIVDLKQLF